jgi:hypothetical protein
MAENLKLAKALREAKSFLQGASNAAASNVSAPVDAIAWALRKAGVPVGDAPIGGSDWMRQKGLTAEAPGASGLIGESVGGVAPIVASAKAAQIAKGLLQAGENLAAPATMNPQAGAIVWHGSPHKFEAFDASKIGTGEGAQAYGHGLYLAESPEVAKEYATRLTKNQYPVGKVSISQAEAAMWDAQNSANKMLLTDEHLSNPQAYQMAKNQAAAARTAWETAIRDEGKQFYKVDLPDEAIAKMLDYDNPVSEAQRVPLSQAALKQFGSGLSGTSGENLYKEVVFEFKNAKHPNPAQAATDWLRENGIPGIRYLDGGSRSAGQGSSNYVVFPGNESLLTILERNGQLLGTK